MVRTKILIMILNIVTVILFCNSALGQGCENVKEQAFECNMRKWVYGALDSIGPNISRYILQRAGCKLISQEQDKKKDAVPSISLTDQVAICEKQTSNFICKTTLSLVREKRAVKNEYYDYCEEEFK
jgi:hypothetical protein